MLVCAILGMGMDKIKDEEEEILHKDFTTNYLHLLELVDIHRIKETHKTDAVFGIKIFNEQGGDLEEKIIVPSQSENLIQEGIDKINKSLNGVDINIKNLNISDGDILDSVKNTVLAAVAA